MSSWKKNQVLKKFYKKEFDTHYGGGVNISITFKSSTGEDFQPLEVNSFSTNKSIKQVFTYLKIVNYFIYHTVRKEWVENQMMLDKDKVQMEDNNVN